MNQGDFSMKIDGTIFTMTVGGGTVAFTAQSIISLLGLLVGVAGIVLGILRHIQSKRLERESIKMRLEESRRNDIMEEQNKIARERLDLDKNKQ